MSIFVIASQDRQSKHFISRRKRRKSLRKIGNASTSDICLDGYEFTLVPQSQVCVNFWHVFVLFVAHFLVMHWNCVLI